MVVFVLAAGRSSRMGGSLSKILLPLGGRRVIDYVLDSACQIGEVILVVSPDLADYPWPTGIHVAVQKEARGTGDAFSVALEAAKEKLPTLLTSDIVTLFGDMPLITMQDLAPLLQHSTQGIQLMGMYPKDPSGYGRIEQEGNQAVRIVEASNATAAQKEIRLCNTAIMRLPASLALNLVSYMRPDDVTGEYYLTAFIETAHTQGFDTRVFIGPWESFVGVNTRQEWSTAHQLLQERFRTKACAEGAFLQDPNNTYLSYDTKVAQDVVVAPHVHLGPGVCLKKGAVVHPFCVLSHCTLEPYAQVGPFAHLRDHVVLGEHAKIGNFVEVKHASLGAYTQAKHLSYLGDASIGDEVTIGAGVITCNYDGHEKKSTTIKEGALVGVHATLVAPVTIGARSTIGAGSVITKDVPDHTLGIARTPQSVRPLPSTSKHLHRPSKRPNS